MQFIRPTLIEISGISSASFGSYIWRDGSPRPSGCQVRSIGVCDTVVNSRPPSSLQPNNERARVHQGHSRRFEGNQGGAHDRLGAVH